MYVCYKYIGMYFFLLPRKDENVDKSCNLVSQKRGNFEREGSELKEKQNHKLQYSL